MANTVIQLKFSDVTSAPTSLNVGEAAYSNTSQKLFIGDTANNVLTIGGKFFTDQQGLIFTKTNVAFDAANSAGSYANSAFATANTGAGSAAAGSYANSAFVAANSAGVYANSGFAVSNSAASYANSAFLSANNSAGVNLTQNTNITNAGTYANSAFSTANSAFAEADSAASYANSAFLTANTPSSTANSAAAYANGAFAAANTKLSSSGGTITGNLDITGNLTVSGNTTFVNTEILSVEDSLIKLANNNTAGDTLDIGFYGMYKPSAGAVNYTGLARTAGANTYFLFRGLTNDPTTNALASGSVTASNTALLVANVQSYAISINGIDVETNEARIFTQANSAFAAANTADAKGTSAGSYANSAFLTANTPSSTANSAAAYANGAFAAANTKLSSSGGTITGNLDITGNLTVSGNTTFVNTEILSVEDSLIKLANNNTAGDTLDIGFYGMYKPSAGAVNYTGLARTAGANTYFLFRGLTNDPTTNALASGSVTASNTALLVANVQSYAISINGIDVETNEARIFTQANSAFAAANTADAKGTSAGSYANSAFLTANTPNHVANSAASYANSAFIVANNSLGIDTTQNTNITNAGTYANAAFLAANTPSNVANSAASYANSAFVAANSAGVYANSAFAKANTDFTNISTTAADHGTASSVPAFRVEANGRISSANSTAIAIAATQITSGTLSVARGGSGAGTFTNNGVLLGQGTSAFTTASSSTEGHLLTINASGVPTFSHLQGGTF